ncbi:MAG: hypothetical protein LBD27_07605 [Tannerella sp.]|nr:hypothetical protein [Tannerella sp.]
MNIGYNPQSGKFTFPGDASPGGAACSHATPDKNRRQFDGSTEDQRKIIEKKTD